MSKVWPFVPREEMIEVAEWATDVIRTKASEQRIALRKEPIVTFRFSHILDAYKYTFAQSLVEFAGANSLYVPDWTFKQKSLNIPDDDFIECNAVSFLPGQALILWVSDSLYERVIIESLEMNGVTLTSSVAIQYESSPYVMPSLDARPKEGISGRLLGNNLIDTNIEFELTQNEDYLYGAGTLAGYKDRFVITDVPIISAGLNISTVRDVFILENVLGTSFHYPEYTKATSKFTMSWHEFDELSIDRVKAFIYGNKGRQKEFWLQSFQNDVILTQDATNDVLTVKNCFPVGEPDDLHLLIHINGVNFYRQVVLVEQNADDQDLTLDYPIGIVSKNNVRVSRLTLCRFDSDRVEFLYKNNLGMSVTIPCVSV